MADIIDFKSKEKKDTLSYWRCNCGCITHYARSDGLIECARCRVPNTVGFWKLPDGEVRKVTGDDGVELVDQDLGNQDDALEHVTKFLKAEPTACFIILMENGTLHVWGKAFDTRVRKGWLRQRLEQARKLLVER